MPRSALVALALVACRPAPPPPEPARAAEASRCAGPSLFVRPREDWHRPVLPAIACEPAPGRAGWVREEPRP